jgi:hypothetical protein
MQPEPFLALKIGPFICTCTLHSDEEEFTVSDDDAVVPEELRRRLIPAVSSKTLDDTNCVEDGSRFESCASLPREGTEQSSDTTTTASGAVRDASSSDPGADQDEAMPGHPLLVAFSEGRFDSARRELEALDTAGATEGASDPRELLGGANREQIYRISETYQYQMGRLAKGPAWISEVASGEGFDIEASVCVADGYLQLMFTCVYHDCDIVKCYAAQHEQEHDLGFERKSTTGAGIVETQSLVDNVNDGIWRVFAKDAHTHVQEDNIMQFSSSDALDEPEGKLWCTVYSPPEEGLTELRGVPLPAARSGSTRVGASWGCFTFEPLRRGCPVGFRMTGRSCVRPSRLHYNLLWMLPARLWRSLLQHQAVGISTGIRAAALGPEIEECMRASPRADFYRHIRRRHFCISEDDV